MGVNVLCEGAGTCMYVSPWTYIYMALAISSNLP